MDFPLKPSEELFLNFLVTKLGRVDAGTAAAVPDVLGDMFTP